MEVADTAMAGFRMPGGANRISMNRIIREALTVVVPGSLAEGRLLDRFGFELGRTEGKDAAGQKAFNRALAIARYAGNAGLELNIVTSSTDSDCYQLRLKEAATKSLEAIEQAVRAGDTYNEAHPRLTTVRALMVLGRGKAAKSHASSLLAVGERLRDRY